MRIPEFLRSKSVYAAIPLLVILLNLIFQGNLFADTLVLKSGRTIQGTIVERNDEFVRIETHGSVLTYSREDVLYLDRDKPVVDGIVTGGKSGPSGQKQGKQIETEHYILYFPAGLMAGARYPTVIALSPSADAPGLIKMWRDISEMNNLIIFASKDSRNGMDVGKISQSLYKQMQDVCANYDVIDQNKIIAAGFSGGGMTAHAFAYYYPKFIRAVIVNTGMIHENLNGKTDYPSGKIAVFLASPTDFRYTQMQKDSKFLGDRGWDTLWIEFQGGHTIAPAKYYEEAIKWIKDRLR